jgi:hypothetical protein
MTLTHPQTNDARPGELAMQPLFGLENLSKGSGFRH